MATIKKTNIYNYLKAKFSNNASHIKMNGSQSAGSSDLIARADHVHPSDTSRAPTSHNHGNLLNNGQVGSTVQADKPLITDSNGKITIGIFGNGAKTFCEGNDPRLSDKRNPTTNFIDVSSTNPVDLNAIREIGFYCTLSPTGAQYVSNCPYSSTGSAPFTNNKMFYLLVESLGNGSNKPFVKQTLTYHNSNTVWVRTKNGGDADDANWSSWEKISLEGHTHQLNDVGLTKIEANADFETYKQQGFYYVDYYTAQSCDNMPFKTGGLLIVRNLVGGVSQTFQRYNGTEMWYRTYPNGGEWNGWKKISLEGHTHTKSQIEDFPTSMTPTFHTHNLNNISIETIGENADFNAYGTQALMKIDYYTAQSCDNMPFKTGGLLIVRNLGGGISQTFQRYNEPDMWYRTYYNSRWNDWKKISFEGHTHQLNDVGLTKIEANADFETYKQQGFYYIDNTNAQSSTNMPFKTGGLLIVRNLMGGVSQTFQRYNGTEMWYKTYSNGEDQWSNWNKICFVDHTHGNIQSGGTIGSDANKPLITTTSGKITTGSFGNGPNTFCEGNDSRITNAVKSACKIGFGTSSSAPGDAMNLSVAQGNPLYAFVRDANGNVPTGLAGGAFLFNGSPRSVTINSNGIMSLNMNTAGTFIIHAIVSDGDGYQVAAGFCRITVS